MEKGALAHVDLSSAEAPRPTPPGRSQPVAPIVVDVELRSACRALVTVAGVLDAHSAPAVRQCIGELVERRVVDVVVDVGDVERAEPAGVAALVGAAHRAQAAGGSLALRRPSPQLQRVLDLDRASDVLAVAPTA